MTKAKVQELYEMTSEDTAFQIIAIGICYASICTSLPIKEATDRLNADSPTGISSRWKPSKDKTFRQGQPNPCQCEEHKTNKHYLFVC